jgi:hypothetical protein
MCSLPTLRIYLAGLIVLAAGCSAPTPEKKLLGKWSATASMDGAVDQALDSMAPGQQINPLARGAAAFIGKKIAEATMSVEVDFHKGGTVFFRGNTDVLGLPPDSDGNWEVSESGPDLLQITFGTEKEQLRGKILFRDKDEFTLKLDAPGPPPPAEAQGKEAAKASKQLPSSMVFKRNRA